MFLFSIFYKNETALVLILLVIVTDIMLSDFEFNWSWHVEKLQKKMLLQGVQGQIFMFQFALKDRNMQARFGLKVFWES